MTIETKFEIGQKVYFTKGSIIYEGKVISVDAFLSEKGIHNKIEYALDYVSANFEDHKERTVSCWFKEEELYPSFISCFKAKVRKYEEQLRSNYALQEDICNK